MELHLVSSHTKEDVGDGIKDETETIDNYNEIVTVKQEILEVLVPGKQENIEDRLKIYNSYHERINISKQ